MDEKLANEVKQIADRCGAQLLGNYPLIRESYQNAYNWPELDPVRYEICLCIAFGLNQAAIAMTNHLFESMLKYGLIYQHSLRLSTKQGAKRKPGEPFVRELTDSLSEGKKLYANMNLNDTINRACSLGLITKEEKSKLHEYREKFRNAYSHADKEKTFGAPESLFIGGQLGETEFVTDDPCNVRVADILVAHGPFQVAAAQKDATPYFLDIDTIARQIVRKVFPKANER